MNCTYINSKLLCLVGRQVVHAQINDKTELDDWRCPDAKCYKQKKVASRQNTNKYKLSLYFYYYSLVFVSLFYLNFSLVFGSSPFSLPTSIQKKIKNLSRTLLIKMNNGDFFLLFIYLLIFQTVKREYV